MVRNSSNLKYYILAPGMVESGGPELAHQMCAQLRKRGCLSYMYYIDMDKLRKEPADVGACKKYEKYQTEHVTDIEEVEDEESVFIVPEMLTAWLAGFKKCIKVLWWMSVDNYINTEGQLDFNILKEQVKLHLVQSHYAYQFLLNEGIEKERILYVSDYISDTYGQFMLPGEYRQDIALYNPLKGYDKLKPLMDRTKWLKWIPLNNLTEEKMAILMQASKVYVDYGNHPGKDRIPREAAACGCCIIVLKRGAAVYWEDVPIPETYKAEDQPEEYERMEKLMLDICRHYEEHISRFEEYRKGIISEKKKFEIDVNRFVDKLQML